MGPRLLVSKQARKLRKPNSSIIIIIIVILRSELLERYESCRTSEEIISAQEVWLKELEESRDAVSEGSGCNGRDAVESTSLL